VNDREGGITGQIKDMGKQQERMREGNNDMNWIKDGKNENFCL
jgi:hypothetical protein